METAKLQVDLSAAAAWNPDGRRWVHLSQRKETGRDKTATMADIAQMTALAAAGVSAFKYKKNNCPAVVSAGSVTVDLDFFVWPSHPELSHTVFASRGYVSPPAMIDELVEFSLVFGRTDAVELDFILSSIEKWRWETPCFDEEGQELYNSQIYLEGLTTVRTGSRLFGVARIVGRKIGARHTLSATLVTKRPDRPDSPLPSEGITPEMLEEYWGYTDVVSWNGEKADGDETADLTGFSADNLALTVTAVWTDTDGLEAAESMRLELPACVMDLLNQCGGNPPQGQGCGSDGEQDRMIVYISECTGEVIDERLVKGDPDNWCTE